MLRQNNLEWKQKKGYKIAPPIRTKLDSLLSDEDDNSKNEEDHMSIDSADCVSSEEDVEDIVFQKSILPTRTGNFDIDFPPSPTVPKGGKNKSKKGDKAVNNSPQIHVSSIESSRQNPVDVQSSPVNTNYKSVNKEQPNTEEPAETNTEINPVPDPDLDIYGNIRASGVVTIDSTERVPSNHNSAKGR